MSSLAAFRAKRAARKAAAEKARADLSLESVKEHQIIRDDDEENVNIGVLRQEEQEKSTQVVEQEKREKSLMELRMELEETNPELVDQSEEARRRRKEAELKAQLGADRAPLESARQRAMKEDVPVYIEEMLAVRTSWRAPRVLERRTEADNDEIRKRLGIIVHGEKVPPICTDFDFMKLPPAIMALLKAKGITKPTYIQQQGLPVLLSGRDMIGIASTGSGKTLVFALPLVLRAMEAELKEPLTQGEGPIGIILETSRELAVQTQQVVQELCDALAEGGVPAQLREELAKEREKKRRVLEAQGGEASDSDDDDMWDPDMTEEEQHLLRLKKQKKRRKEERRRKKRRRKEMSRRKSGRGSSGSSGNSYNNDSDEYDNWEDRRFRPLPALRSICAVGGESVGSQCRALEQGAHILVGTPGRIKDLLARGALKLRHCEYLCLDEADRLIDVGFEDDIRRILDHFPVPETEKDPERREALQRQTLFFSATMPKKIEEFALSAMRKPVVVNVGRAGAAALKIRQDVEICVDDKRVRLERMLACLKKTRPPVIVFATHNSDVDDVHEFLLRAGVDAVSIHGKKSQEERRESVKRFRGGEADVLVASDVAGKGLDFPRIRQVINFDMPKEIEDYVHRIGRTGRRGQKGVASTLLTVTGVPHTTLLDLKHLLRDANQKVPDFLLELDDPTEGADAIKEPCLYCGGFGHRSTECPKLRSANLRRRTESVDVAFGDM
ncbi:MAG: hypothetical protein MHM6MM_000105 [Cercozoa sp. M6MM]